MPSKENKPQRSMKHAISELSTMIFGLALSIGALTLINTVETSTQVVLAGIVGFAYSFMIIIFVWFRYTKVLEIIKVESRVETNLNILLLFLVAIEPYLFNLLNIGTAQNLSFNSAIFGLDLGAMLIALGVLYKIAWSPHKKTAGPDDAFFKSSGTGLFFSGIVFLISVIPQVWGVTVEGIPLRFALWVVALVGGVFFRRLALKTRDRRRLSS